MKVILSQKAKYKERFKFLNENIKKSDSEKESVKEFDWLVNHHIVEEYRFLSIRTIRSKCPSDYAKVESKIIFIIK